LISVTSHTQIFTERITNSWHFLPNTYLD